MNRHVFHIFRKKKACVPYWLVIYIYIPILKFQDLGSSREFWPHAGRGTVARGSDALVKWDPHTVHSGPAVLFTSGTQWSPHTIHSGSHGTIHRWDPQFFSLPFLHYPSLFLCFSLFLY